MRAQALVSEVVPLRTGTDGSPLFCVDPQKLAVLAAAIRENRAVYGVDIGNFGATAVDLTVESIAASHVRRLSTVQHHRPCWILGYSFGGLIAYEMASSLVRSGREVAGLVLIDTPHPAFQEGLSASESAVVKSAYLADRKLKYLGHLRRGRFDLLASGVFGQIRKRLRPAAWRAVRRLCGAAGWPAPLSLQDLRIEAMWHAYRPAEFPGRMLLFRAEGRDAEFTSQPAMGWDRCVHGGVDVRYSSGRHEDLFVAPYAVLLARQIDDALGTAGHAAARKR